MQSTRLKYFMSLLITLSIVSSIYLCTYSNGISQNNSTIESLSSKTEKIFTSEEKKIDKNIWIKIVLKNIIEVVII